MPDRERIAWRRLNNWAWTAECGHWLLSVVKIGGGYDWVVSTPVTMGRKFHSDWEPDEFTARRAAEQWAWEHP